MEHQKMKLSDQLSIETYPFSDYITCIEVFYDGQSISAFCSDSDMVEEWKQKPEQLLEMCQQHAAHQNKLLQSKSEKVKRIAIEAGIDIEMYTFSDDVYCVNVYQNGDFVSSFCSDKQSMEEWEDDPDSLKSIVKSTLKT